MTSRLVQSFLILTILFAGSAYGFQEKNAVKSGPAEKQSKGIETTRFQEFKGLFNFYWDDEEGKIWLGLDGKLDQPFLYVTSLATGLGSNPVGLDRGQLGTTRMVRWIKVGRRVFLEQMNLKFRASSSNPSEREAVANSFANSVIWAADIKKSKDGQLLVDLTDLIVRDAHQASRKLSTTGQGTFSFDQKKSFPFLQRTRAFPDNCEFEAVITLTSSKPGSLARRTSATGNAISLRQHHSFVRLPDDRFQPRKFDPRCGSFAVSYQDYSVPIDQPIEQRLITRHRLIKRNPKEKVSEAEEPIVYYVDSGVPSPIKEALIEGASWWNDAFEDAGYKNAFQVKVLPADADPMDVRYNVIQWVHRATRGWSYGQSVVDPRTGEIIKGHVLLGSLRVRQDLTLMNGFRGRKTSSFASQEGRGFCSSCMAVGHSPVPLARLVSREDGLKTALARIRQLSAHEVGHTLGFAHNFAASTYADRASVMDYPAPRTSLNRGKIDLSDAYGVGVGVWDRFMVRYAYSEFANEKEEQKGLSAIVKEAINKKWRYMSDADARPSGAAHPLASLWDNGSDPVASLRHEMAVRKLALTSFSEKLIDEGEPMSELEKSFVPIYLHHRYQVEATAKMIGGVDYDYAVRGDRQTTHRPVSIARQRAAFELLLKTLEPEFLIVPEKIQRLLAPKSVSSAADRERFTSKTSPVFDVESAIEAAADLTLSNLLQPQRLARVAALNHQSWDLTGISKSLRLLVLKSSDGSNLESDKARRVVQGLVVERLIRLASDASIAIEVQAWADSELRNLNIELKKRTPSKLQNRFNIVLVSRIDRYLTRSAPVAPSGKTPEIPPGSPIGNR